jgi:hypothetical protein
MTSEYLLINPRFPPSPAKVSLGERSYKNQVSRIEMRGEPELPAYGIEILVE